MKKQKASKQYDENDWELITYMVYDAPKVKGKFSKRIKAIEKRFAEPDRTEKA